MPKNHHALDTGGGAAVKIEGNPCLERFQADPIWEIPDNGTQPIFQGRLLVESHDDPDGRSFRGSVTFWLDCGKRFQLTQ